MSATTQNASVSNGTIQDVKDAVNDRASGAYSYAQRSLDRVVPPSSRQRAYDNTSAFASARPILFSFIATQLLLSFLPLLVFATFSLSTLGLAFGAALVFALFWVGVALLVLVPTLLLTATIAVLVWAWALGSFIVARWLYNHAPGVSGGVKVDAGGKRIHVVKDEPGLDGNIENTK